jgi:glycosyltransferase involved in cell wall biosynthesis
MEYIFCGKKMKIAVFIDTKLDSGGSFQCSTSNIKNLSQSTHKDFNFIFFTTEKENLSFFKEIKCEVKLVEYNFFDFLFSYLKKTFKLKRILRGFSKLDHLFLKHKIDIVYFVNTSAFARDLDRHNFIFTLWDLCHLDHPEFPEVSSHGEFESRQELLLNVLPKATNVVVESEIGKENLVNRFNIEETRIKVLPVLPSLQIEEFDQETKKKNIDIKVKYSIPGDYIFYPAQFWPHKNHIYILKGLKKLKDENFEIHAIFTGSDKGNQEYIKHSAQELNLSRQIHFLGFVDNEELPYLYKQSLALVMPTYFGPTNLPPEEASILECPILYSNLPDLKEQVAGRAQLIDLKDPNDMAIKLIKVINNDPEIKELIHQAKNNSFEKKRKIFRNTI